MIHCNKFLEITYIITYTLSPKSLMTKVVLNLILLTRSQHQHFLCFFLIYQEPDVNECTGPCADDTNAFIKTAHTWKTFRATHTAPTHTHTHTHTHSQTSERFQLSKYRLTGVAPESTGKLPTQCLNQEVWPLYQSELHAAECTALTILEIRLCQCRKMVCSPTEKCQVFA